MNSIPKKDSILYIPYLSIEKDIFLNSKEYTNYIDYKIMKSFIKESINNNEKIVDEEEFINSFVSSNKMFFYTYEIVGNYYKHFGDLELSRKYFNHALTLEISNKWEEKRIVDAIKEINQE